MPPNPVRHSILLIGLALARVGIVDPDRVRRTTDLAWPRIVTGLARMSKSAVDVALVGTAIGPAAIAGVGFASPFWVMAFSVGGGVAGGTIALASQRFGADAHEAFGQVIRSSVLVVLLLSLPMAALYWLASPQLIGVLTDNEAAIEYGATYLQIVALAVPLSGLNLVGSRTFIAMDDAWTPMVLRAGGATLNIVLSGVLIFGFGLGVAGAAIGTVVATALVTLGLAGGIALGRLPGLRPFPVAISLRGTYVEWPVVRDIAVIGLPVLGTRVVWAAAEFPLLAIVDIFGQDTFASYVIARRILALLNTPGWGFGLAASSLVGQSLGVDDEQSAEAYGRDIICFSATVYAALALPVFVFAEPITLLFVGNPADFSLSIAVSLVRVAAVAVIFRGIARGAAGALNGTGDTRWPFYSQLVGMVGLAIPLAYIGARSVRLPLVDVTIPALGLLGLYLAFFAETTVPAAINAYRFTTGKWKAISREYRPEISPSE